MKNEKKHLIIGTVICAATMLLFLAFSSKLPDIVPIQIATDGSVGNTLPKPVLVFGMPIVFAVVNLVRGSTLARKEKTSAYRFYIVPGIAVLISIGTIILALNM